MEVRALCFSLMIRVLFLLAARDEVCCSVKDNTVFPQIIPNRQQFFEYEPITVSCEGLMGLTGWRVMKRIRGKIQPCAATWESSTGPCRVENAIPSIDSGEYWCEIGAKKISSVHITVTAGPVVLDSPAVPVFEGDDVTLSCRNKELDSNSTAQFFKDGVSMGSSVTGSMTIYGVSSFDEGLYKCRISEGGESPQSWFTVREAPTEDPPPPPPEPQLPLLLQICISLGIFLVVLLLSAGLLQCKKRQTVVREGNTGEFCNLYTCSSFYFRRYPCLLSFCDVFNTCENSFPGDSCRHKKPDDTILQQTQEEKRLEGVQILHRTSSQSRLLGAETPDRQQERLFSAMMREIKKLYHHGDRGVFPRGN
ncbi:uncharacterized protein LOC141811241 [Halichoeres trimaculatus]|uniref:uncharacterized protein LOC141811241 n=1 Tax=Halichoeres trimaculatus TaxID=147232 RepID=UPI003D9E4E03